MNTCGCGKILKNNEPHDCAHSSTPTWSKVFCPACAGDGCRHCDMEGRVWPERFEAIIDRLTDGDEVHWCDCGRLAQYYSREFHEWLCPRCPDGGRMTCKRSVKNFDGTYRLCHGRQLQDSGDVYNGHDTNCALCRSCVDHSTWAHWALLVGEVPEHAIDHYVHTVL